MTLDNCTVVSSDSDLLAVPGFRVEDCARRRGPRKTQNHFSWSRRCAEQSSGTRIRRLMAPAAWDSPSMAGTALARARPVPFAKLGAGLLRERGEPRDDLGMLCGDFALLVHVVAHVVELEWLRCAVSLAPLLRRLCFPAADTASTDRRARPGAARPGSRRSRPRPRATSRPARRTEAAAMSWPSIVALRQRRAGEPRKRRQQIHHRAQFVAHACRRALCRASA